MSVQDALALARRFARKAEEAGAPVIRVVLFGSYAQGNPHEWSDIDLAVVTKPFLKSRAEERKMLWHLGQALSSRVEALSFRPEDLDDRYSPLIHEINTKGIDAISAEK